MNKYYIISIVVLLLFVFLVLLYVLSRKNISSIENLTAVSNTDGIHLSWSPPDPPFDYYIYKDNVLIKTTTSATFIDPSNLLTPNQKYKYHVSNKDGTITSDTIEITYTIPTFEIQSMSSSESSLTIQWNNIPGATMYHIYRDQIMINEITAPSQNPVVYIDENLQANTKYQYNVKAINANNYSELSNTLELVTLLTVPNIIQMDEEFTDSSVVLYIETNDSGVTQFEIIEDVTTQIPIIVDADDEGNAMHTVTNLSPNTQYTFYIKSLSADNYSEYISTTVTTRLEPPYISPPSNGVCLMDKVQWLDYFRFTKEFVSSSYNVTIKTIENDELRVETIHNYTGNIENRYVITDINIDGDKLTGIPSNSDRLYPTTFYINQVCDETTLQLTVVIEDWDATVNPPVVYRTVTALHTFSG